ncbi:hypothetical protein [Streptomyces sp. NPDC018584]|uniref:hypothetical protein n=1 Tax=unclassified Streptomyces TaxID=2593676 RepID=UPI00378E59A2
MQRIIPPVIVLFLATLGALDIQLPGLEYSDSQLISAMLALIAIDAFVDRMDSSRAVESELGKIRRHLAVADSSGIRFAQRIEQEKIADLIGSARKRLWIAGPSNDAIVQCREEISDRLQHGVQVRVLMVDPTDELIEWYGRHAVGPTYRFSDPSGIARAKARLEDNRDRLIELKDVADGAYEMRVLERIMWFGFIIIDAGERDQRMDVQVYMYKKSADTAPILRLNSSSDAKWWRTFMEQYELYWAEARDVVG